jgi:hypothetical protein
MTRHSGKNTSRSSIILVFIAIIMTVFLMAFAIYSMRHSKAGPTEVKIEKIRTCPDNWYVNRMPGTYAETDDMPNEYMVYEGRRVELRDVDVDWVKENCAVKEPQPIY